MKKDKSTYFILLIIFSIYVFGACQDMDYKYYDYVKDGPIIYAGKTEGAVMLSGNNRVLLRFKCNDPKVSKLQVTWQNGLKTITLPLTYSKDTTEVFIDDLDEGTQVFDLVTFDDNGNKSINVEVQGTAYGHYFQQALKIRDFKSLDGTTGEFTLARGQDETLVYTEVDYYNNEGQEVTKQILPLEMMTVLDDCDYSKEIKYRGVHKPNKTCVDEFRSEYVKIVSKPVNMICGQVENQLARDFVIKSLPGDDIGRQNSSSPKVATPLLNLFDGSLSTFFVASVIPGLDAGTKSCFFTLDLKRPYKITAANMWCRLDGTNNYFFFNYNCPQKWKLYGANGDEPGFESGDMSAWTLIGEGETIKPSGGALGSTLTADDIAYVKDGFHTVMKDNVTDSFRYVRVEITKTWKDATAGISEIEFYYNGYQFGVEE